MTQRRAMLILHGKQSLNEDVRDAVADKRKQGWELDVRLTWEAGDAQRLVNEALAPGTGILWRAAVTAPCVTLPKPWRWLKPRPV